jgi:GNAT superfamily N-acetyltransferase
MDYSIVHTTEADLPIIYWLFEEAIAYQQRQGYIVWNGYSKEALQDDIALKRQYKIEIDGEIACIFTVFYSDEYIWGALEQDQAVYLHRVVTNPNFRGRNLFQIVFDWTVAHAHAMGKALFRIDTWADNPKLVSYYLGFGFKHLGNLVTPDTPALPLPYRSVHVSLLELDLEMLPK